MRILTLSQQIYGLIGWLGITFIAGALAAMASIDASIFYYEVLVLPTWAPPAWLFGPVWATLYIAMGIAAWLVWRTAEFSETRSALLLFLLQLSLNALWSWVFFIWQDGMLALINIVLLWILIAVTLIVFIRIHKLAGCLLVPYLLWVNFAAALNLTLLKLNPLSLGSRLSEFLS